MTVGDQGRLVPSEDPSATLATPPQVDTSQTMESMLAARAEMDVAESHEDQRLQQEASEEFTRRQGREDDSLQQVVEMLEEGEPSGWDNAVDGLFGEGGEMHQALRAVEDATNGIITVPGAPGAGFGTPEYWEQGGWTVLIAASMEAAVPLVVAGVPVVVGRGATILRPNGARAAAHNLRTAATEAHSATLQYQRLRGGRGTENLLRTERAGDITGITPPGMHPGQAVRTPTGQMGPMTAEQSAAFQNMVSAQQNLARAGDRGDGLHAGFTLSSNRGMGLADDLMLHRGGTPVYFARPGVREVLTRSPGSRNILENMPRPPSAMSSSQASNRLTDAYQRMISERARHQQVVSGFDRSVGPSYPGSFVRGKPGTPATTNVPTTQPPGPLSYQRRIPEERWLQTPWNRPSPGQFDYIGTQAPRTWTARPGPMQQHEQFVQRSYEQYRRAAQEYDDLIEASGRLSEGREAAEGLRLLQTTLGRGNR